MIHIFMAYSGGADWKELAEVTVPIWRSYAQKHGYGFYVTDSRPVGYTHSHIPFERSYLALCYAETLPDSDYLWVVDLDTLITNNEVKIEQFLNEEKSLFFCQDVHGINAGNYIAKVDVIKRWLADVIALSPHSDCENRTFINIQDKYKDEICIVPHPAFNSTPYHLYPTIGELTEEDGQWRPNHLLMHLPGMTPEARTNIFKNAIERSN